MLDSLNWLKEFPPLKHNQRFGNQAFRQWHRKLVTTSIPLCKKLIELSQLSKSAKEETAHLDPSLVNQEEALKETTVQNIVEGTDAAVLYPHTSTSFLRHKDTNLEAVSQAEPQHVAAFEELHSLFIECFGNASRIDYGTGHELAFITFGSFLREIGALQDDDLAAFILNVFGTYLTVVQELQKIYWLEPAGSKGAWGIDDYQFLCFLFGASQFCGTEITTPREFFDDDQLRASLEKEFMLADTVNFISKLKSSHLSMHSPILFSLGNVESWEKVTSGLIKMYGQEVLSKFPIMQHVLFGSVLSFNKHQGDSEKVLSQFKHNNQFNYRAPL